MVQRPQFLHQIRDWSSYLDFLVLHLILDRSEEAAFLSTVANLQIFGHLNHGITELVID